MKQRISPISVPKILPDGGTVLVLGAGPSLTQADVDLCRGRVDATIAVNNTYALMPDATCLYAADLKWWTWHDGAHGPHTVNRRRFPAFCGRFKYTMVVHGNCYRQHGVEAIQRGPGNGLSFAPTHLATGHNGVYQAMNLALHFGATRILLLGVDMQGGIQHFDGRHPDNSGPPIEQCLKAFKTLVEPMQRAGVDVINCTRTTALKAFPQQPLEQALCVPQSVAV